MLHNKPNNPNFSLINNKKEKLVIQNLENNKIMNQIYQQIRRYYQKHHKIQKLEKKEHQKLKIFKTFSKISNNQIMYKL